MWQISAVTVPVSSITGEEQPGKAHSLCDRPYSALIVVSKKMLIADFLTCALDVAGSWSELSIQCKAIAMLDCIAKN